MQLKVRQIERRKKITYPVLKLCRVGLRRLVSLRSYRKKSLYISPAVSHFYGTGYEIWAGLAVLKIMNWAVKYATFAGNFGQNIFLKYC